MPTGVYASIAPYGSFLSQTAEHVHRAGEQGGEDILVGLLPFEQAQRRLLRRGVRLAPGVQHGLLRARQLDRRRARLGGGGLGGARLFRGACLLGRRRGLGRARLLGRARRGLRRADAALGRL